MIGSVVKPPRPCLGIFSQTTEKRVVIRFISAVHFYELSNLSDGIVVKLKGSTYYRSLFHHKLIVLFRNILYIQIIFSALYERIPFNFGEIKLDVYEKHFQFNHQVDSVIYNKHINFVLISIPFPIIIIRK